MTGHPGNRESRLKDLTLWSISHKTEGPLHSISCPPKVGMRLREPLAELRSLPGGSSRTATTAVP